MSHAAFSFNQDYDLPFFGGPSVTVLRSELRLETAVGIYLGGVRNLGLGVVVAPWILLGSPGSIRPHAIRVATWSRERSSP